MDFIELIEPIAAAIVGYVLVTASFVGFQLLRSSKRAKMVSEALYFVRRWNDHKYAKSLANVISHFRGQAQEELDIDSDLRFIEAVMILEFFEELALAVKYNVADERVARDFFIVHVADAYNYLGDVIETTRYQSRDPRKFINIERLFGLWVSRDRDVK